MNIDKQDSHPTDNRFIMYSLLILIFYHLAFLVKEIYYIDTNNREWLCDFYGQWALCAYAFRGIDPFPQIGADAALLPEVGIIPAEWGTSPWGLLLGQLFYPGYLPLDKAQIYFGVIYLFSILSLVVVIYLTLRPLGKFFCFSMMILTISSYSYWLAAHQGNCGGIICSFIIMACLLNRRYPVLSGILLGFAMVKPQTALIICFAMLLAGRWKTLLTTAVMVSVSWIISALYVDTGIWELMGEFLAADIGGGDAYRGIAEPLQSFLPQSVIMPLSMLAGVLYVWLLWRKKKGQASTFLLFTIAAIAADFWCYSWNMECFMLFLPAIAAFYFALTEYKKSSKLIFFLVGCYCCLSWRMIPLGMTAGFFLKGTVNPQALHYGFSVYDMGLILCGLYLCRYGHWEKLDAIMHRN